MNADQFLRRVVPAEGTKVVAFLNDENKFIQFNYTDYSDAANLVRGFSNNGQNAYFSLASFKDGTLKKGLRTTANVAKLKSFWIDLDGKKPDKPKKESEYESKQEAFATLNELVARKNLPPPMVIQSGWGIHVYWTLTEEIDYAVWRPVAEALKALLLDAGFNFDTKRTADAASVLRPVETLNYKVKDRPLPVKLIRDCEDISLDEFKKAIGYIDAPIIPKQLLDATPIFKDEGEQNYPPSNSSKILSECIQLQWCSKNQSQVPEPLWFHGITVLAHTTNGKEVCHEFSSNDAARYDAGAVDKKIQHVFSSGAKGAPALCTTFNTAKAGVCTSCPHWGKIKSPIVLGYENTPQVVKIVDVIGGVKIVQERVLPPIPEPYFGSEKGLFLKKEVVDKEGNVTYEHEFVLQYPLYLVDVYDDVNASEISGGQIVFTYKNPRGRWTDIRFNKIELDKADKIAEALNRSSLYVVNQDIPRIKAYMRAYLTEVYKQKANTPMVKHFGWSEDNLSFALGKRLYTPGGIKESVPSPQCYPAAEYIVQKGNYAEWREAFNTYFGKEGMELPALISGAAFGSVLLKFLNEPALVVNIYGASSGMGKTSTALMIESTFGDPDKLKMRWEDTKISTNTRSAVLSSLPIFIDEIHNAPPEEISKFVYGSSSGRGKNRAMQDGRERANDTVWNNIWITTSNMSLVGSLLNHKGNSNAEQARLIEVEFASTPWQLHEAKPLTEAIKANHGWALDIFVKYCVENLAEIESGVRALHNKMLQHFEAKPHERFWFAGMAAILFGCELANNLGITTYDIRKLKEQVKIILARARASTKDSVRTVSDIIAQFYGDNYSYALEVEQDKLSKGWLVKREPRGRFFIRFEVDTNKMVVLRSMFNKWCTANNIEIKDFYDRAKKEGILVSYDDGCSLCKGTSLRTDIKGRNVIFSVKKGDEDA